MVTDQGVFRTKKWERSWDASDPPRGRDSLADDWLPSKLIPDYATHAAFMSVRQGTENGILKSQRGTSTDGQFHPVRHFHSGSAYERYRRGMPPGYMGHIPQDAVVVTGGKIGVIEKKHPVVYSYKRPATGSHVAQILADQEELAAKNK